MKELTGRHYPNCPKDQMSVSNGGNTSLLKNSQCRKEKMWKQGRYLFESLESVEEITRKQENKRQRRLQADEVHMGLNAAEVDTCNPRFLGRRPVHYFIAVFHYQPGREAGECAWALQSKAVYTCTLLQIQKADPRRTHSSRNRKKTNTHGTAQRWSTPQQHFKLSTHGDEC